MKASWRGLRLILRYLARYRTETSLGLLGLVVSDAAQLTLPFLTKHVIDGLAAGQGPALLRGWLLGIAGLAVVAYGARCLWRFCFFGIARRCDIQIRRDIYTRAIRLSLTTHAGMTSGHVMSLATSDVLAVRMVLAFALMSAFDALVFGFLSMGALVYLQPRLALYCLLPYPVLGIIMKLVFGWSYAAYDKVQRSLDEMTEKARESIAGIRVLRTAVQEDSDVAQFAALSQTQMQRFLAHVKLDGLYSPATMILSGAAAATLLSAGGADVVDGTITVGDFAAFAAFLAQLTWPMVAAAWTLSLCQRGAASMERIDGLLGTEPEPLEFPAPAARSGGSLEARALSFTYPGAPHPALRELSFALAAGGSLGIVGEVGSGKSTLVRLLLRLYTPPPGALQLDGCAVESLPLTQLRASVAWVEQEAFLFSQSIAENLRLGHPAATFEQIQAAAEQAELHAEVLSFPQGYDTLLGERGVTLSGGQKQRLCLARALLKPAPLLVLDDTLSAVDAHTEEKILQRLNQRRLDGQQTLLVISHRISSVRDLDQILVLHEGTVVGRGTHAELLAQGGFYARLHDLQTHELEEREA